MDWVGLRKVVGCGETTAKKVEFFKQKETPRLQIGTTRMMKMRVSRVLIKMF